MMYRMRLTHSYATKLRWGTRDYTIIRDGETDNNFLRTYHTRQDELEKKIITPDMAKEGGWN